MYQLAKACDVVLVADIVPVFPAGIVSYKHQQINDGKQEKREGANERGKS